MQECKTKTLQIRGAAVLSPLVNGIRLNIFILREGIIINSSSSSRQLDALLDPGVDAGRLAPVPLRLGPRLPHGALPPLLGLLELEAVLHPRVPLHLGPLRCEALVLLNLEGDRTPLLVVVIVVIVHIAFQILFLGGLRDIPRFGLGVAAVILNQHLIIQTKRQF